MGQFLQQNSATFLIDETAWRAVTVAGIARFDRKLDSIPIPILELGNSKLLTVFNFYFIEIKHFRRLWLPQYCNNDFVHIYLRSLISSACMVFVRPVGIFYDVQIRR